MTHRLIVDVDDDWEVEHPPSCPTREIYDGMVIDYTCGVGRVLDNDSRWPGQVKDLPAGEYPVWYACDGAGELFDEWLVIGSFGAGS